MAMLNIAVVGRATGATYLTAVTLTTKLAANAATANNR
jgi:hypothetical protein